MEKPVKKTYKPTLRESYRYRAARRAVLTPFFGLKWLNDPIKGMYGLRKIHLDRLDAQFAAGRDNLDTPTKLHFAKKCPFFGTRGNEPGRTCNDPTLCPFCYARTYIIEPFKKMETFLYGGTSPNEDDGMKRTCRPGWHVIGFRRTGRMPLAAFNQASVDKAVDAWRRLVWPQRGYELMVFRGKVACVLTQFYTFLDASEEPAKPMLGVVRCGVLLTQAPHDGTVPEKTKVWAAPASKKTLCDAFGNAMRFPKATLSEPIDRVLTVWRAFHGKRMRRFIWKGPRRLDSSDF